MKFTSITWSWYIDTPRFKPNSHQHAGLRLVVALFQILGGVSYEHAEGRAAALNLCDQVARRLPEPNLDELSSVLYLSLVVRLVSDPDPKCREGGARAVTTLLSRVSAGVFQQLLDLTGRWFGHTPAVERGEDPSAATRDGARGGLANDPALRRTAAQATGLFISARPELFRKGAQRRVCWLLASLSVMLPRRAADVIAAARSSGWGDGVGTVAESTRASGTGEGDDGFATDWEGVYHAVLSIGKAFDAAPAACYAALTTNGSGGSSGGDKCKGEDSRPREILERLLEALLYPHAWVRLATARLWSLLFSSLDPVSLCLVVSADGVRSAGSADSVVVEVPLATSPAGGRGKGVKGPGCEQAAEEGLRGFLTRKRALFRLCQNVCSQLNRSQVGQAVPSQFGRHGADGCQVMTLRSENMSFHMMTFFVTKVVSFELTGVAGPSAVTT